MAIEKKVELKIDAEEALKRLEAVEKELGNITKASKKTAQGTSSLAKGFSGIGLAWKAIGIGAVISGLQFLAEKFSANQQIMDKVNIASAVFGDVMTKIGTVVISVVKGLGLLGKAVGKVLKGEFKEAGDLAAESFNGVKEAVVGNNESFSDFIKNAKEGAKETVAYAKALTSLNKEVQLAEANQRLLQLQYQKDAEVQRQIRDDISLTFEERIAANEELGRVLDEQFAKEQALAQKKIDLAALELSRNKDNIDLQVALIDAKTEMADLDERITGQRSEQLTNLKALEKERSDALAAQTALELKNKEEADKKKLEAEKLLIKNKEMLTQKAVSDVIAILGEESKAAKAIQVGMAIRDTYLGATKALAQGGIFGALSAGGIIAMGLANVRKIISTGDEGASAGGGGVSSSGIDTDAGQPAVVGDMLPNMEEIAGPTLGEPQPVQAYVVENDISNAQALQEELDIQATL